MEHVWDWIEDEDTQKCLQEITKPGARLMWAGTFTKNWTTNLTKMGINEATSLKLARKIRKQIMHNTAEIWRTRCNATHDNKEREEIVLRMREAANDAQKHGVLPNANESVQRACEIHKKIAERKKWIVTTEKRTAKAIKEKTNRQKQNFLEHFRVGSNRSPNETGGAAPKDPPTVKDRRPQKKAKKATNGEDVEERIHRAKTNKKTTTRKATIALESSDSEEETPQMKDKSPRKKAKTPDSDEDEKRTHRATTNKQTSTQKTTRTTESSDSEEEPQKHKATTTKRKRTGENLGTRDAHRTQTLPPKGDAATEEERTGHERQQKRKKESNTTQKKQKKTKKNAKEKKRKQATNDQNQRKLDEFMQPAKKSRHGETTRAQEEAKDKQSRSQDSYDPG
jgi:hypothetical protein